MKKTSYITLVTFLLLTFVSRSQDIDSVYLSGSGENAILHVVSQGLDRAFDPYSFDAVPSHKTVEQIDAQRFVVRESNTSSSGFTEIHYSINGLAIICDSIVFDQPTFPYAVDVDRFVDVFAVGKNILDLDPKTDLNYDAYLDRLTGNNRRKEEK